MLISCISGIYGNKNFMQVLIAEIKRMIDVKQNENIKIFMTKIYRRTQNG